MRWRSLLTLLGPKRRAAGALVIRPDQRLLLVRDRWRGEWAYPAGYVEPGERPLEACARELEEEIGLRLDPARLQPIGAHTLQRPRGPLRFTTYKVEVSEAEAEGLQLQALELSDHRWVSPTEARKLIAPRLQARFAELLAAQAQ